MNITNRENWIDYCRGLGIILMIVGHSAAPEYLDTWIYGFHMPMFYILSGYLYNKAKWDKARGGI